MSYLSNWVAKLEVGHTITDDELKVLRRVEICLVSADKHHQQAREGQTMQDVLEQEVERQTKEITALYQTIARCETKIERITRERDSASQDAMQLYCALITLGITKGEVNKQERWWHVRPDNSEGIYENVMLAADALWADYRRLANAKAAS